MLKGLFGGSLNGPAPSSEGERPELPNPTGKTDLLLRFFDSQFFDEWIAITYVASRIGRARAGGGGGAGWLASCRLSCMQPFAAVMRRAVGWIQWPRRTVRHGSACASWRTYALSHRTRASRVRSLAATAWEQRPTLSPNMAAGLEGRSAPAQQHPPPMLCTPGMPVRIARPHR